MHQNDEKTLTLFLGKENNVFLLYGYHVDGKTNCNFEYAEEVILKGEYSLKILEKLQRLDFDNAIYTTIDFKSFAAVNNEKIDKIRKIGSIERTFEAKVSSISMFDYIAFLQCHSALAAAGYFITDENREEKYIKIITSENTKLCDTLERYLLLTDIMSKHFFNYNQALAEKNKILFG